MEFIEIYAVFVLNLCGENLCEEKNDKYEIWPLAIFTFLACLCTYCKVPVNPLYIRDAAMYKILSCLPNHKSPLKAKERLYKVGVINILHCEEFETRRKQTTIKCYGTDTNTPTSLKLNIE